MNILLQDNQNYIIRFDPEEDVIASLSDCMVAQSMKAVSFYGIGSCSTIELGYYNAGLKDYRRKPYYDNMEVISLIGNGSLVDGKPLIHAHGVFGRTDFSTLGGHVFKLITLATCEIFLTNLAGQLNRQLDDKFNLKLLK